MSGCSTEENNKNTHSGLMHVMLRILLILLLSAAVVAEGYYILVLKGRIDKQTEEIKNVSMQLQLLKLERGNLSEELSSIKKSSTGENRDGDPGKR